MIWALLVGCPRARPGPTEVAGVELPPVAGPRTRSIRGPLRFEEGGLCLEIPVDWTGTVSEPLRLALSHPSGVGVTFSRDPGGGFPADRAGYHAQFDDAGTYRSLPGFAATRSWLADDPFGDYLQAWYGEVGGAPLEILVRYPPGRVTASEPVVDELLAARCGGS